MSGKQNPVDPVQLAASAAHHEIRVQPQINDMKLARSNSAQAQIIADGIEQYKTEKTQAEQKETMAEALPHISKQAVSFQIKASGRVEDMKVATDEDRVAKVEAIGEGIEQFKTEKTQAAQKEIMHETLPHISLQAVGHQIRVKDQYETIAKADANAETTHKIVDEITEIKLSRVESKAKENHTEAMAQIEKH